VDRNESKDTKKNRPLGYLSSSVMNAITSLFLDSNTLYLRKNDQSLTTVARFSRSRESEHNESKQRSR
jgi:hypothetical protein